MLLTEHYQDHHRARAELAAARVKATRKAYRTILTTSNTQQPARPADRTNQQPAQYHRTGQDRAEQGGHRHRHTAPCRHFTPPPSQEPRPSAFSAIRFPLSWPTREDVKRVDSAHRIGSISSSTHIQHSLSNLSSTTPIYPTCQSQSRPSRHRQSLSLNPPHLSLARSLFLRALSSGRPLVTVVPCYVMSRLVHVRPVHRRRRRLYRYHQ